MSCSTTNVVSMPTQASSDVITELCREGARRMLTEALEAEVAEYVAKFRQIRDASGKQLVVRNGYMPERKIQTGVGPVVVKQPRVNDRRVDGEGNFERFSSAVLPPYLRRTKSIDDLIPWLYLKGISTGDFSEALMALLGRDSPGLSATTVTRLKAVWQDEFDTWNKRSFAGKRYVYFWADGIYFNVRLGEDERQCILVIMGATLDGKKELIAIDAGLRESELSWSQLMLDLKKRGLETGPSLAIGDGALGFWSAIGKQFPNTAWQRCWVHKTANILNALPKSQHSKAKGMLHEIWMADTMKQAEKAFDHFVEVYGAKHEKATKCLSKDRDELLAFYKFPAEHWKHIRTTNPIESTFATVRLRTKRTKGCGSANATLMMVFKLARCAEKKWHRLGGHELLADVIDIKIKFVDGVRAKAA